MEYAMGQPDSSKERPMSLAEYCQARGTWMVEDAQNTQLDADWKASRPQIDHPESRIQIERPGRSYSIRNA